MEHAFWDSSALVPLCVKQQATPVVAALSARFGLAVWWSTPVEIRSAFARLVRTGRLTGVGHAQAVIALDRMRQAWQEVEPNEQLRDLAERLIDRFTLKAADAQQLAAALVWCLNRPQGRAFISGDAQLLYAARQLGFKAIEA